ncbi:MAG: GNAT family N-acetyltransferase [Actinomycetota bacterium]
MTTPPGARLVTDPDELESFYADRRAAHIYALVDLEEPFWEGSRWYRRDDAVAGVVALPDGEGLAVYAVSTKDPDGSAALVCELAPDLPTGLLITGPAHVERALSEVRPIVGMGPHVRYELTNPAAIPARIPEVVDLGPEDEAEIQALYDSDPGAAFFLPHMLVDDAFVGVRSGGRLVAAAGTHVLSERQRIAAVGAVYTRPEHRGNGFGAAVTAGVIHRLGDRVDVVGLNVHADNTAARAIYRGMAFEPILGYAEAELA